jgi:hypothetical protein
MITSILALLSISSAQLDMPGGRSLLLNSQVGEKFIYEARSVVKIAKTEGVMTSRYEMTVVDLEPKGTATFKTASKGKYAIDGKEIDIPESVVTAKMELNGRFLSVEPPSANATLARGRRIMQYLVTKSKAIKGSHWAWTEPGSPLNGNMGAAGQGDVVEFGSKGGVACAKLHISIKETEGALPASAVFDVWISLKDGMQVESEIALENVPVGTNLAKMNVKIKRVEK